MIQTLQGALQQSIRNAFGCANDFNGDLHVLCDFWGIPPAPISGRLIPLAQIFEPSISSASSALNYLLANPLTVVWNGPTLDLIFAPPVDDQSTDISLDLNFVSKTYKVAAQYTVWE